MNATYPIRRLLALGIGVCVFAVGALLALWPTTASQAYLQQTSVSPRFVACKAVPIVPPPVPTRWVLRCTDEDGNLFAEDGLTPPPGYRFYLTDVMLLMAEPMSMLHVRNNVEIDSLIIAPGYQNKETHFQFSSPYFVLWPGDRMLLTSPYVAASGYLQSSHVFLPSMTR